MTTIAACYENGTVWFTVPEESVTLVGAAGILLGAGRNTGRWNVSNALMVLMGLWQSVIQQEKQVLYFFLSLGNPQTPKVSRTAYSMLQRRPKGGRSIKNETFICDGRQYWWGTLPRPEEECPDCNNCSSWSASTQPLVSINLRLAVSFLALLVGWIYWQL